MLLRRFQYSLLAPALLWTTHALAAPDASRAEKLAQSSNCFKCHAIDRKKESTAWREIAGKYRTKANAVEQLTHHVTSGEKVKFDDGHEEQHKVVKTKDPEQIRNLVDWILSL